MKRSGSVIARPSKKARKGSKPARRFSSRGVARELKFFDTNISFTADLTTEVPATGQLTLIPQDDTQSGRDGRVAVIKSIDMHGIFTSVPAAAAQASTQVRVFVVLDTQCNGAAATAADANSGVFTSTNILLANPTLANQKRFKILHMFEQVFNPTAGVTTAWNNEVRAFRWFSKCHIPIEYDASVATGAITSIRSNNIFLVAGSSSNDDIVSVDGVCRLRFMD